ncbi:protein of unknown function [Taphrina deformans PYCC 5710]|uniref:Signal peptidase complex subunit 1 n=1 Tax=Taphrina deformans (strain PYCC 5710 / ATCC 11124 / CBS 356.35 / IMI 108563 / JCM 9778 / NBRC 8474) TaxID=1097556 RepID=R4XIV0_TAPDE|nr:protein of unknown function [Taphrina deformans PYCC 5710]|eukprot:CCG84419.1 protein of unknown function [Taphrina deformans PYCC 5710]
MDKIGLVDFQGQKDAQMYMHLLLYSSAVLAFLIGFVAEDVFLTLYLFLGGVFLTFAAIVPPRPFFKAKPVVWLENESKKAYAEAVRKLQAELDQESAAAAAAAAK